MPAYHIVGDELLTRSEFRNRYGLPIAAIARTEKILALDGSGARPQAELSVKSKSALQALERDVESFSAKVLGGDRAAHPFTPIGRLKPLTILVRHVYTGRHPMRRSRSDMIVVSGLKDHAVSAESARMLNFYKQNVEPRTNVTSPDAFEKGTRVVAYYPAVITDALTTSFEIAFDRFDSELSDAIADAAGKVAQLPIFLPWSGYLMGAGSLVKLAGRIGNFLFDREPILDESMPIDLEIPGSAPAQADFRLLCRNRAEFASYTFVPDQGCVSNSTGETYGGDEPYIVISLDGAQNDDLQNFAPLVASSELLGRFCRLKENSAFAIDAFVDAMRLVNDFKYWSEANDLKKEIEKLSNNPERKQKKQQELDAILKNIGNKDLKVA